ncbi:galactose-1-epimerase [Leuconostoc gelidum]|uniref:galactose-1-epimerase n=1 Tax=Leuconostoc gelidum TaxID=1244 RepID=UPI001C7E0290|nr:galactose-1-epimerase [Leuconostoc gelidum]MBZ6010476.1 galactose-1-epimerase [Leuconostoc gelidum subsp. aenigmaticum]
MNIIKSAFGDHAKLFTMINDNGVQLAVTDFGARIVHLNVPINNERRELILGFDSAEEYIAKDHYIGATIGRVAGRIANGSFQLNQTSYQVVKNENDNTLHGGPDSFEMAYWQSETDISDNKVSTSFTHTSPNQNNGFPGNLTVKVTYTLDNDNVWQVSYEANSDAMTLFNPTNHVYFNLTGHPAMSVADHMLSIDADHFAPLDDQNLTTGEQRDVSQTAFDFRKAKQVNEALISADPQNQLVSGLDHPFLLNQANDPDSPQARLVSPDQKVAINMRTTAPSVVVFTANFGDDYQLPMRQEQLINHGGITLETQVAPGAEKYPAFGNIVLPANEVYQATTRFDIDI